MDTNYGDRTGATTVKAIEYAVAYFFGMRVEDLHRKSTARAVEVPRQIAMYLIKQMTNASVPQIGRHYGKTRSVAIARSIAKLDEQRSKRGVVDLVIRELVEQAELRLTRERTRLSNSHRKPM